MAPNASKFEEERRVRDESEKVDAGRVEAALVDPCQLMKMELLGLWDDPKNLALLAFAYAAVAQSPRHFKFLRTEFRGKKYLARMALAVRPGASAAPPVLSYVSEQCAADKELVLIAVEHWAVSLQYASLELQDDKDVVLVAVKGDGMALEFASDRLRSDKKVVLEAVKNRGLALEFACDDLRDDEEVALQGVTLHWAAFDHVGPKLMSSKMFVLRVTRMHPRRITSEFSGDADFEYAVNCALALQGDETMVVMVLVRIVGSVNSSSGSSSSCHSLQCEASTVSGMTIAFQLSLEADLGVLAEECRKNLQSLQVDVPRRIHINLAAGNSVDDDDFDLTMPTPLDARRKVVEFLGACIVDKEEIPTQEEEKQEEEEEEVSASPMREACSASSPGTSERYMLGVKEQKSCDAALSQAAQHDRRAVVEYLLHQAQSDLPGSVADGRTAANSAAQDDQRHFGNSFSSQAAEAKSLVATKIRGPVAGASDMREGELMVGPLSRKERFNRTLRSHNPKNIDLLNAEQDTELPQVTGRHASATRVYN